eukprot:TRINITY_DN42540_c0_g1_i2.p1 TRINITY_DN42540_c0_g1~~TRINITY_DN42540_c0_g1_i2.p1  ORF type:complete len:457 (+),score=116.66 TRINITY_DN42540_c0_g1_i2:219-1589(+)
MGLALCQCDGSRRSRCLDVHSAAKASQPVQLRPRCKGSGSASETNWQRGTLLRMRWFLPLLAGSSAVVVSEAADSATADSAPLARRDAYSFALPMQPELMDNSDLPPRPHPRHYPHRTSFVRAEPAEKAAAPQEASSAREGDVRKLEAAAAHVSAPRRIHIDLDMQATAAGAVVHAVPRASLTGAGASDSSRGGGSELVEADGKNVTVLGSPPEEHKKEEQVAVISSWVLIHVMGNHTGALQEPELSKFALGLRDAVADALEVCRPSVGVADIRAINIDLVEPEPPRRHVQHPSLVQNWQRIVRSDDQGQERWINHVNVTQMKAVYEVRVLPDMRMAEMEIARRIDRFQIYGKFSELGRLLSRSFGRSDRNMDGVVLDDVGYASRHVFWRPPLSPSELEDCTEEVMLRDTRQLHQYVVALSLVLVAFITCAGSAVFTIKHPSIVPSRLNPLAQDRQ